MFDGLCNTTDAQQKANQSTTNDTYTYNYLIARIYVYMCDYITILAKTI